MCVKKCNSQDGELGLTEALKHGIHIKLCKREGMTVPSLWSSGTLEQCITQDITCFSYLFVSFLVTWCKQQLGHICISQGVSLGLPIHWDMTSNFNIAKDETWAMSPSLDSSGKQEQCTFLTWPANSTHQPGDTSRNTNTFHLNCNWLWESSIFPEHIVRGRSSTGLRRQKSCENRIRLKKFTHNNVTSKRRRREARTCPGTLSLPYESSIISFQKGV